MQACWPHEQTGAQQVRAASVPGPEENYILWLELKYMKDGKETTDNTYSAKPWDEETAAVQRERPRRLSKSLANTINLHSMVMTWHSQGHLRACVHV